MTKIERSILDIVIVCDPAISEKASAARTAIVVVATDPMRKIFLLDYWVGRQGDPARIIDTMLDFAHQWQPRLVGFEAIAYQQALKPYLEREMQLRGEWYPIKTLKPDRNEKKNQRILSLQPFFKANQIFIQRGMLDFIEEYETFPLGKTVDLLDAFAYAVRELVPKDAVRNSGLDEKLKTLAKVDPNSARLWRADAVKRGILEAQYTLEEELEMDATEAVAGVGEWF